MPIIAATDLVKDFTRTKPVAGRFSTLRTLYTRDQETVRAVAGVTLEVAEGEIESARMGRLHVDPSGKSIE